MKVLQLIDSLNPGGAEKMAINLANGMAIKAESSYLCCTRNEGSLKDQIQPEVGYLFINKKCSLDLNAFINLRKFILKNNINIIHAHGTSYFLATLLKLTLRSIKLVWHDHFGNRIVSTKWNFPVLYLCSYIFDGIIVVNTGLKKWSYRNLLSKKVKVLPNFISNNDTCFQGEKVTIDKGKFNIIFTANFKAPKNHLNLLKAFTIFLSECNNSHLILIGNNFNDNYYDEIKNYIHDNNLQTHVTIVKNETRVFKWLCSADLGVLSSDAEGLPLALIEYGMAKLPVISTNVGDCKRIIDKDGIIVQPNDPLAFSKAMEIYYSDSYKRDLDAINFNYRMKEKYSSKKSLAEFLKFYSALTIQ